MLANLVQNGGPAKRMSHPPKRFVSTLRLALQTLVLEKVNNTQEFLWMDRTLFTVRYIYIYFFFFFFFPEDSYPLVSLAAAAGVTQCSPSA